MSLFIPKYANETVFANPEKTKRTIETRFFFFVFALIFFSFFSGVFLAFDKNLLFVIFSLITILLSVLIVKNLYPIFNGFVESAFFFIGLADKVLGMNYDEKLNFYKNFDKANRFIIAFMANDSDYIRLENQISAEETKAENKS